MRETIRKRFKMKTREKGITLMVLVITIIVLLILAAVTTKLVFGEGGILGETKEAVNEWDKASSEEQSDLAKLAQEMRNARNGIYNRTSGSGSGDTGESGGNNNETGGGSESGGNEETEPTHKPSTTEANSSVSFVTETGKIDVIWLDTNNKIIDKPNSPASHLGGMVPVKWGGDNGVTESETTADDTEWYNYASIEGDGDNTTSHWANAKNFGSYFVWIPRYAYRITYYTTNSSQPTGYYDGCGMWKSTGELKLSLEEGIETVVKDGWSYIVHPAFINDRENGYSNGGWDSDLAGIWVGKYEASRSDATSSAVGSSSVLTVRPGVKSDTGGYASYYFSSAYNYERTKESHLMKNSEWGAIVYLTHSQYGRNAHQLTNNNTTVTGGAHLSGSTGNIYGVYGLSGGANEAVAVCKGKTLSDYGFEVSGVEAINNNSKYANTSNSFISGTGIYNTGKVGEATKEVFSNNNNRNWFSCVASYGSTGYITTRGGAGGQTTTAGESGPFYINFNSNSYEVSTGCRIVLSI